MTTKFSMEVKEGHFLIIEDTGLIGEPETIAEARTQVKAEMIVKALNRFWQVTRPAEARI